jgi:hypothetical protein
MGKLRTRLALLALVIAAVWGLRRRELILARLLRLPAPQYPVLVSRDLAVPMPDGAALLADHYYPAAGGDFPTILVRTPYGRSGDLGILGPIQDWFYRAFAARGYHVIVQSVRGRFGSDGEFEPFASEADDGQATLEWIAAQPWFNGALAMWGPSYMGYVQWAVAADAPPYLRSLMPAITTSRFGRMFYHDGVFALEAALRWIYLLNTMQGDHNYLDLKTMYRVLPARRPQALLDEMNTLPPLDVDTAALGYPVTYYRDWLHNSDLNSSFWQQLDHPDGPVKTEAAVHLVAGWYDIFLHAQLSDYAALLAAGRRPYLTIYPKHHLDPLLTVDALRDGLAWFAGTLKDEQDQIRRRPVRVYVMGAHEWHEMDFWPPPAQSRRYFLHPGSRLSLEKAAVAAVPAHYRYDPANPPPVVGGPLFHRGAGKHNQWLVEQRSDLLVYTSEPLSADVDVIGPVRLELFVRSSRAHTDFVGRLCDVLPDGRSMNVCEGIYRVEPGKGEPQADGSLKLDIDLWATAQRFKRGHRIRLQVASAAHPRWMRNLGSDEPIAGGRRMLAAEQTIYHDAEHPSALVLPIVDQQALAELAESMSQGAAGSEA